MLKDTQYKQILEELDDCQRPLYFFHDDADGLCSFLLLYKYKREGKGVCVKAQPKINDRFYKVVKEYQPDKIFVLDIANIDQDFAHEFRKIPIVWIDHHVPTDVKGPKYFNPMSEGKGDNTCVSELCYNAVKEDLWIAAVGIVSDWQLSKVTQKFSAEYPELLSAEITNPPVALFDSPLSKLIRIFNFVLKGPTQEVNKCVKIMTRIETPNELLDGESPRARFILKRFEMINKYYQELLDFGMKKVSDSRLIIVKYKENKMSFSGELANELLHRYPKKVIVVGREKSGEVKCSVRSGEGVNLPVIFEKVFTKIPGYGGGHEHACGACVPVDSFDEFIEIIEKNI